MIQLPKKKDKNPKLTAAKDKVLDELIAHDPNSPEWTTNIEHLERLTQLETDTRKPRLSRDVMFTGACAIGQVLVIVIYEQKHVFASQAKALLTKLK